MQTLLLDDNVTEIAQYLRPLDRLMWALTCRWAYRAPALRAVWRTALAKFVTAAFRWGTPGQLRVFLTLVPAPPLYHRWLGCVKRFLDGERGVWGRRGVGIRSGSKFYTSPDDLVRLVEWVCNGKSKKWTFPQRVAALEARQHILWTYYLHENMCSDSLQVEVQRVIFRLLIDR